MGIADYLECTIYETNDLLLAAEHLPLQLELRTDQQRATLDQARRVMHSLPLPAVLFTRGWQWEEHNRFFQAIHPSLVMRRLRSRSPFDVVLDPMFPFRQAWAPDAATWRNNVQCCFTLFREVHRPFRREGWYRQLLEQARRRYPDVAPLWSAITGAEEPPTAFEHRVRDTVTGAIYCDRAFTLTFGPTAFPQLMVIVPVDAAGREVFQRLGCAINEDGWLRAVRDLEENNRYMR